MPPKNADSRQGIWSQTKSVEAALPTFRHLEKKTSNPVVIDSFSNQRGGYEVLSSANGSNVAVGQNPLLSVSIPIPTKRKLKWMAHLPQNEIPLALTHSHICNSKRPRVGRPAYDPTVPLAPPNPKQHRPARLQQDQRRILDRANRPTATLTLSSTKRLSTRI